jgi:putative MATE family efflux protein
LVSTPVASSSDAATPAKRAETQAAISRRVLALALPVLAQQMLVLAVGLSDRYLAGHLREASPDAAIDQPAYQAAQTTAQYLGWCVSSYMILVSVGSTALVARFTGAKDDDLANRTTHQSILLGAALGLIGCALGLWFADDLVRLLQLQGEAADFAAGYLRPMFLLLPFQVIEAAGISCLVGRGDTRTGLYVMAGVTVVNFPLAWGLCLGLGPLPRLGFVGIALGTAVSHCLGAAAVLTTLVRGRFGLQLHARLFRLDMHLIRRLLRVSVPAGIDSLSMALCQLWFLSLVNSLGDVAGGAHGIALGWEATAFLSGAAFGTAAMTLVGYNLGAGRPDLAARSGWTAFALGCGIMSTMGVIFFSFAPSMFRLFCPQESQIPIVEAGIPVLRLVAFAMPALASAIIFTSALRGAGDTVVPVVFTWIGFLGVRIPLAYVLALPVIDFGPLGEMGGFGLGLFGAWLAMLVDIWVRGTFFLVRFAGGRWKSTRV